jgi:catechol 2,3-dioxygenase-like lactoylglutathione lyase family enzyme
MSEQKGYQIHGLASVLYVKDFAGSLAYYRDVLGFSGDFVWGNPPFYAVLCLGEAAVHLNALAPAATQIVCIFCSGVDALHAELAARGARIKRQPQDEPYGMREFEVSDPDGHRLVFGEALES